MDESGRKEDLAMREDMNGNVRRAGGLPVRPDESHTHPDLSYTAGGCGLSHRGDWCIANLLFCFCFPGAGPCGWLGCRALCGVSGHAEGLSEPSTHGGVSAPAAHALSWPGADRGLDGGGGEVRPGAPRDLRQRRRPVPRALAALGSEQNSGMFILLYFQ